MRNELGHVRRSQAVTSYGPGSIIDFRAGGYGGAGISVVAAGLEEWDRWAPPPGLGNPQTVFEPRLERQLNVEGFRLPPVAPQVAPGVYSTRAGKLVGVRYPQWLQCPTCHIIRLPRGWAEDPGDPALFCADCSQIAGGRNRSHVLPVRFIVLCPNGHLDEFPWDWWVRHRENCPKQHDLKLEGSATAGLAGLILSCLGCGERRSMEGCFGPSAIPEDCAGHRPWLGVDAGEACSAKRRVVQRGASNIYFPVVESALDIPPWSDELQKKLGMRWSILAQAPDRDARRLLVQAFRLHELTGLAEDDLLDVIEDRIGRLNEPERNLRWEEYQQLVQHSAPFGLNTEFEIHPVPTPPELTGSIQSLVRATRLREVRVVRGFTRVFPPTPGQIDGVSRISNSPTNWLPAVENRGEGIFVQLRLDRVHEWESLGPVQERASAIQAEYLRSWTELGRIGQPSKLPAPRLLLVHSLAHALIQQLSLTCGYGSASLRERLYVDVGNWDMAAFLIFTSSPDADGTLGGLARQGEAANFVEIFESALASMTWCSSDPLCIEGIHAMSEPSNGAACHACLLAAETSCEEFNAFLDRTTLIGTPAEPELGFFADHLHALGG